MKALLLVLLVCVLVLLLSGAQVKPALQPIQPTALGRYQIIISPSVRADIFMLDTQTGSTWKPTQFSDVSGQPMIWKYQDKVDNAQELREWGAHQVMTIPIKP